MAIRDIDLTNRQTHIFVSGSEALFPRNDLFPADDLFPVDSGIYLSHNIVAGSMKLDEIIVDGDTIVFGNLYSTKFEVQIFGSVEVGTTTVDIDQIDFHGKFIFVYQEDNGVFKRLFTGVVDSAKKNRDGLDKTLIAYDSAYALRNVNVADWWAAYWSSTALMYNQGNLDMAVAFYSDASSGVETYLNSIYPASTYNTRYALNLYDGKVYLAGSSAWTYNQTLSVGTGNKVKLIDKTSETPVTVYKTPLGTLRESVLSYLGIDYENVLLTNDYLCVAQDVEVSLLTFGTLMRMIYELNCCFPHFGRDNRMVFIVLDVEGTAKNINGLYDGSGSTFEEFVTEPITGIQFLNSDGDAKYTVGQTTNVYTPAKDNIFLLTLSTDDLKLAGNNMLDYVSDLSYCPFNVHMIVGDLQYEVGDLITTSIGTHFIFKNSFSGAQFVDEVMECQGNEIINEVAQPIDTSLLIANQKIAKMIYDVEHFYTEFTEYKTTTNGTISEMSTSLTQTAEAVTIEAHSSGKEWDTTGKTIDYYGSTDPTDSGTKASGYPASGNTNKYYLNKVNGKLYKSNGSTWVYQSTLTLLQSSVNSKIEQTASSILLTVAGSQKEWDTSGYTISAYGYTDTPGNTYAPASYSNKYYLNQTNGKLYKSNGSLWVYQSTLTSVQASVESKISTTVGGLSLSVTNGSTSSTIKLKSGTTEISSQSISFTGFVTFTGLSGGTTTIDGACIKTGKIKYDNDNYFDLSNGNLKTTHGTFTGTISASTITGSTVTGGGTSGSKVELGGSAGYLTLYYNNSVVGRVSGTTDNSFGNHMILYGGSSDSGNAIHLSSSYIRVGYGDNFSSSRGYIEYSSGLVNIVCSSGLKINSESCANGAFEDKYGHVITVKHGLITDIGF